LRYLSPIFPKWEIWEMRGFKLGSLHSPSPVLDMQNVQEVVAMALSSHSSEIVELRATTVKQQKLIEELSALVTTQVSLAYLRDN
jgi:hypothetical protein